MFCVSVWRFGVATSFDVPAIAWATALVCGFLASFATINFQRGIRLGKISTSWLIINLSTALPTILSIVMYREAITTRRALGLLLAIVALLILWFERRREERASQPAATLGISIER
jgi:drug/metabolite transporter (DMT)-like permease